MENLQTFFTGALNKIVSWTKSVSKLVFLRLKRPDPAPGSRRHLVNTQGLFSLTELFGGEAQERMLNNSYHVTQIIALTSHNSMN